MISIIVFEHLFFLLYYNTNPLSEQVFLLFIYKDSFEHLCSAHNSSHYLKEVGEFLLSFVKEASESSV